MGKPDYNTLLSQYNRLVAAFKDLQEQKDEAERTWRQQESDYKQIENSSRELCKMIMAKRQTDVFLGKSYSLDSIPIFDLLNQAKQAFVTYNNERTLLQAALQDKLKEIMTARETLQIQYDYLKNNGLQAEPRAYELPNESTIPESDSSPHNQAQASSPQNKQQIPQNTSYAVKSAAEKGKVEILIVEDDEDVSISDVRHSAEIAEQRAEIEFMKNSPAKIKQAERGRKIIEEVKKKREDALNASVAVSIKDITDKLNDRQWAFIQILGETGIFDKTEIISQYLAMGKEKKMSDTTFTNTVFQLKTHGLIDTIATPLPNAKRWQVYQLNDVGATVFQQKFGKPAIPSQLAQIIKDHDNIEHGIGILTLAKTISQFPEFESVSTDRKTNSFTLQSGDIYIPDVIAKTKKYTAYFEYELANHNKQNFNVKLNRMAKKTRYLNIVTNMQQNAETLNKKVLDWIKSIGGFGSMPKYCVRITTLAKIATAQKAGGNFDDPDIWIFNYDLGKKE